MDTNGYTITYGVNPDNSVQTVTPSLSAPGEWTFNVLGWSGQQGNIIGQITYHVNQTINISYSGSGNPAALYYAYYNSAVEPTLISGS